MPFAYTVDHESKIITITGSGTASMDDRFDCVERLTKDKTIDGIHHILIDVSQVSNSPTLEEMNFIVPLIEKMQAKFGGRVALLNTHIGHVTISDLIALGTRRGGDVVRAFLSGSEAREWLIGGTPSSRFEPLS